MVSLVCNFYLSVAAHKLSEQIRPWDTLACCWDVKQPTNKQTYNDIFDPSECQMDSLCFAIVFVVVRTFVLHV